MEEILTAYRLTQDKLRDIPLVYIAAPKDLGGGTLPAIQQAPCDRSFVGGGPAAIAEELIRLMGSELVERCQKAWEINRTLYPEHWQDLDETLRAAEAGSARFPRCERSSNSRSRACPSRSSYWKMSPGSPPTSTSRYFFRSCRCSGVVSMSLDARVLGSYVRGGVRPEALEASLSEVAPKVYAPDETIETVSSVLRGAARIANAINRMQCADAFDIARRYAWPATRQSLLCAVYAAAAEIGR